MTAPVPSWSNICPMLLAAGHGVLTLHKPITSAYREQGARAALTAMMWIVLAIVR